MKTNRKRVSKLKKITAYYNYQESAQGNKVLHYSFFISDFWVKHFGIGINDCHLEIGLNKDRTVVCFSAIQIKGKSNDN